MTDITAQTNTESGADALAEIKRQAWKEGYDRGCDLGNNNLERYKERLVETVLEFMSEYDLCQNGVEDFFRAMDINHKFEHDITITVTFKVMGATTEGDTYDKVDNYARAITEVGFMERNLGSVTVECENYNVEIN